MISDGKIVFNMICMFAVWHPCLAQRWFVKMEMTRHFLISFQRLKKNNNYIDWKKNTSAVREAHVYRTRIVA